jgi:hypothetical protein
MSRLNSRTSEVDGVSHDAHPNPNEYDDPAAAPLLTVGVSSVLLTVAVVFAITGLFYRTQTKADQAANSSSGAQVAQLAADQDALLSTPRWVDRDAGVVAIPIDDAIKLVCKELANSVDGRGPWSPRPGETAAGGETSQPAGGADSTTKQDGTQNP